MRQYTASEVETIERVELTLNLEAMVRLGARRMLHAAGPDHGRGTHNDPAAARARQA